MTASVDARPVVCVIVPVYNHVETLLGVVRGAARHLPVIVVDDGSTDGARALLEREPGIVVVAHSTNRGKGVALAEGFRRARALGYTHAITLDADGQHEPDDIPLLLAAVHRNPAATVLGHRDLRGARAPQDRQVQNQVARVGIWAVTGRHLKDTQTGFRGYPLALVCPLGGRADRYGYELEMLVVAAWSRSPIVEVPVRVDYDRPTSRRSHVRGADKWGIALTNARMALEACFVPRTMRVAMYHRDIVSLPPVSRVIEAAHRAYGSRGAPERGGAAASDAPPRDSVSPDPVSRPR